VAELAETLLAASGEARVQELRQADVAELEHAISTLGRRRESAAAEVLRLIDQVISERALRKAARRELHRLESLGIHAPEAPPPTEAAPSVTPSTGPQVALSEAWATDIDPAGSRAIWLMGEPPLGGAWLASMVLNDTEGLVDLSLIETTRKRYQREVDEQRRNVRSAWVSLPPAYALQLVREAVDTMRSRGRPLPTRYRALKERFGEAEHAPERALVYTTISPIEASFNPELLAESTSLFREREVAGWVMHVHSPEIRARALEVARSPSSPLVLPNNSPEQQALRLVAEAAREVLTDTARRAWRRRLEETAYIFVATERLAAARVAVAVARTFEDPSVGPDRNPFLRALLTLGLAEALQGAPPVGEQSAGETLLHLIERAVEREGGQPTVETTPSGLILPR
jgi:hypothetical protein